MTNLRDYLDSTYLKLANQAGLTEVENNQVVVNLIQEAIKEKFKLAMIRPNQIKIARQMIDSVHSKLLIGTVIDFPKGTGGLVRKLAEAKQAVADGVNELDYVVDYSSFQKGEIEQVKKEVEACTQYGLEEGKTVKWIIETAALTDNQIVALTLLIKDIIVNKFNEKEYKNVFIKSSTGFFQTENNKPNGATLEAMRLILNNAAPLSVKASGGIKDKDFAIKLISLGVKRLGTSSAKAIVDEI